MPIETEIVRIWMEVRDRDTKDKEREREREREKNNCNRKKSNIFSIFLYKV